MPPPPTPRDNRASARDQRRFLEVPNHGLGRADVIRSRSPSPSAVIPGRFNFPAPQQPEEQQFADAAAEAADAFNMATEEQLEAIRRELRNEIRAEVRQETAAAAATVPDAIKRKPEIPPFDKLHVEHWIRRTENAFIRALITSPREKFAFLETKFPVDFNPRINDFLWGDPTEDNWNQFIAYLKQEYGSTTQQRAAVILDGFKRDGRKPSQYVALLEDKTKDLTLDDIRKEMLVREMPTEIQRMLQEKIEGLSLQDAAKAADVYFDQDGKPKHVNKTSSVNAIQEQDFSTCPDDSDDINAINRRFPNQRNNNSRRGNRGGSHRGGSTFRPTSGQQSSAPQAKPKPKPADPNLCFYHNEFGDKAKKCEVGCSRFDEKRFTGNGKAGQR